MTDRKFVVTRVWKCNSFPFFFYFFVLESPTLIVKLPSFFKVCNAWWSTFYLGGQPSMFFNDYSSRLVDANPPFKKKSTPVMSCHVVALADAEAPADAADAAGAVQPSALGPGGWTPSLWSAGGAVLFWEVTRRLICCYIFTYKYI